MVPVMRKKERSRGNHEQDEGEGEHKPHWRHRAMIIGVRVFCVFGGRMVSRVLMGWVRMGTQLLINVSRLLRVSMALLRSSIRCMQ
jgi:hypothetical protein